MRVFLNKFNCFFIIGFLGYKENKLKCSRNSNVIGIKWQIIEIRNMGSCALPGKMLLVRIIENDEIDAYLGQVRLIKG